MNALNWLLSPARRMWQLLNEACEVNAAIQFAAPWAREPRRANQPATCQA